jgi:hypothetical protein
MGSKSSRGMILKRFIQLGLLVSIIVLVLYPRNQPQDPSLQTTPTHTSTMALMGDAAAAKPVVHSATSVQITHTPTIVPNSVVTTPQPALSGASVWILSCLNGWQTQKIYQTNPFYTNQQGVQKAKDIYVFGNFWLQPDTGALWPFSENPAMLSCLSNLITTAHTQYHARVCGVIGVDETGQETPKKWQGSDVAAYTQRAVANPALLTPIIEQAKKLPYDCIINDIEDGYSRQPQIFSQYDALLHSALPVVLGQTLLWKTPQVSTYWQTWEDWSTLANSADFFIVMALDHDSINTPPVPSSVVDADWVRQVYTYMRSIPYLFGSHPIVWELPTYYRLFTKQTNGSWAVSSGTDVQTQIALALQGKTVPQNYLQDPNNAYLEYTNATGQDTYLYFETAKSSDALAQLLTGLNQSTCLLASFWDNDSSTANSLGWSTIASDNKVRLC